jgi:molybdate transport system substrate-binding protein
MRGHLSIGMVIFLIADICNAQTAPLCVLVSGGMQAVINDLRPQIEKELGRPLDIRFGTSVALRGLIEGGEAFDVAVLTDEIVNQLTKDGRIDSKSRVELGRTGIGFGVRDGATEPDVKTPETVKRTMLNAKSLTWVGAGASKASIDRMTAALGIAAEIKDKTVLAEDLEESLALVRAGKNEMIVTLISEIVPAKGIKFAGPLPEQFQNYVTFTGSVNPKSSMPAASALFIKQLTGLAAYAVYRKKGMEPPDSGPFRPVRVK